MTREPWFAAPLRRCLAVNGTMLCDGPQGHDDGCTFVPSWELVRRIEDEVIGRSDGHLVYLTRAESRALILALDDGVEGEYPAGLGSLRDKLEAVP